MHSPWWFGGAEDGVAIRRFVHLAALVVVICAIVAGTAPARALDPGVVLEADTFVDLKWDPREYPGEGQILRWELYRGPTQNDLLRIDGGPAGTAAVLYTDQGVEPDTRYVYRLVVVRCPEPPCAKPEDERSRTVFQETAWTNGLHGTLYRDLKLPSGRNKLRDLKVVDGNTLKIETGTVLVSVGGLRHVAAEAANLHVEGATIGPAISLHFGALEADAFDEEEWAAGWVKGATFEGPAGVRVHGVSADIDISGNTFVEHPDSPGSSGHIWIDGHSSAVVKGNGGKVNILVSGASTATIEQNCPPPGASCAIEDGISVYQLGSAEVRKNTLNNQVMVTGHGASASVDENLFEVTNYWALRVDDGGRMTARGNTIRMAEPFYGSKLLDIQGGAHLTADRNTIEGNVRFTRDGGVVVLTDNVIRGGYVKFDDGTSVSGEMRRNTITGTNGPALMFVGTGDFSGLTIKHNCIAGNMSGLGLWHSLTPPLDVTENWWGHASGPYHETRNPTGAGNSIVGETVLFDPWDRTDTHCRESPPPPPPPESLAVCVGPDRQAGDGAGAAFVCQAPGLAKIIPDGEATVQLRAELTDEAGAPVPGAEVTFTRDPAVGQLAGGGGGSDSTSCTTNQEGVCLVTYVAPTPEDVWQRDTRTGMDKVEIIATVTGGPAPQRVPIDFTYLEVEQTTPGPGKKNWRWEWKEEGPKVVFDRKPDVGFPRSAFTVRTRRHYAGGMPCDNLVVDPDGLFAHCQTELRFDENAKKGLVVTVRLEPGPDGIRGEDGTMLRRAHEWEFSTLPELSARIIPVQISEEADLFQATRTAVLVPASIVRVHAGLSEDTELDWVEADVEIEYDRDEGKRFRRTAKRFYPGELGRGAPRGVRFKGNSAIFRSEEMPLATTSGPHTIDVAVEPVPQPNPADGKPYEATASVDVSTRGPRHPLWVKVRPMAPLRTHPTYAWKPGQWLRDVPALKSFYFDSSARYMPLAAKSGLSSSTVLGVPAPWGRVTVLGPRALPSWIRHLDRVVVKAKTYGEEFVRQLNVLVVPQEWIKNSNEGDAIFHQVGRYVCVVGGKAAKLAVPHCVGHLYGLRDDQWAPPTSQFSLKGFDSIYGNWRLVNGDFSELGYIFPLMSKSIDQRKDSEVWIDQGNYRTLLDRMIPAGGRGRGVTGIPRMTVGGEVVRNSSTETGLIDIVDLPAGGGEFPSPDGSGSYALRLRDAVGAVLAAHAFTPDFSTLDDGTDYASFLFHLPAPEGVRQVELLDDGAVLSSVTASAHAPEVSVTEPTAGEYSGTIEVRWSGTDADPETELDLAVFYTQDGGRTWDPLALATTDDHYELDTTEYSSCDECRIRVVANDGFFTVEADSATFSAINPPRVVETWPADGSEDAPIYVQITVVFRDPMDADTIDTSTFTLTDARGNAITGRTVYDPDTFQAVFSPEAALAYEQSYTAKIDGSVRDFSGQELGAGHVWSFRVRRSPFAPDCAGDCSEDGKVTINELVTCVGIALGIKTMDSCSASDGNADGSVTVNELIRAVRHALRGCPHTEPTTTPSVVSSPTPTSQATVTPTEAAPTRTRTDTPLPPTPTSTPLPSPTGTRGPEPIEYCGLLSNPLPIPDGDLNGVSNRIGIADMDLVTDLDVSLDISHTWVGDLLVELIHSATGRTVRLIDRPGYPALEFGCNGDNLACMLDDDAPVVSEDECAEAAPAISGRVRPFESLGSFEGERIAGEWSLTVADSAGGDTGSLNDWCLEVMTEPGPVTGPEPPIMTGFWCNGADRCTLSAGEPYTLEFEFVDANGDANAWRITAERDDGVEFDIESGAISPHSDRGIIRRERTGFTCESTCVTTSFDFRATVRDAAGLESVPVSVEVVVLGNDG